MSTSIEKSFTIEDKLVSIYGKSKGHDLAVKVTNLIESNPGPDSNRQEWVSEKDVMLITYGDSVKERGKAPLRVLHEFLMEHVPDIVTAVHILPFYPYSSDDGFSVIDYYKVNDELGEWYDIIRFSEDFELMFDAVINHISQHSEWFKQYKRGNPEYENFFIEADPKEDYSSVTRPRALPLLTKVETANGVKHVWTTFSPDQIDLNYRSEDLLLTILELLLFYVKKGARFIRLDAIGFLWKKIGTSCMHLDETHEVIQVMREVMDAVAPGTILITETNVPHRDNISYFGDGLNEAHMVYQFPLPPLTLHTFHTGNTKHILQWADSLEPTTGKTTYFNFLASHDGIGVRPVEGILTTEEILEMAKKVQERGGYVSYKDNGDGTQSPYELNINYLDALSYPDDTTETKAKRFIAAQSVLFSVIGVPGIYIHSLFGSQNDRKGVEQTGRYRSINREKLYREELDQALGDPSSLRYTVFSQLKDLLQIRGNQIAFHPNGKQKVLYLDDRVFSIVRTSMDAQEEIIVLINVSNEQITFVLPEEKRLNYLDLVTETTIDVTASEGSVTLEPYQVMWLK